MHDRVGVRDLRANVAALLRRAAAGERIVITVDGQAVAQLAPLEPVADPATLDDLAARGLLVRARRGDPPPGDLLVPLPVGARLDRLLGELRA